MPFPRRTLYALLPVALLPVACATFDGLLRDDELQKAQEHVETDDQLRRLLAAHAPDAIQVYVAALDRDAAVAAFRAGAGRSVDEPAFRELLERYAFVGLFVDTRRTRLHEGVRWRAGGKAQILRGFDLPVDFVSLTGEPRPGACRQVTDEPLAPMLAPLVNAVVDGALNPGGASPTHVRPMQEHTKTIEVCPTVSEHARVAPRAAALSAALTKPAEAAARGGGFTPVTFDTTTVAFARPVDAHASVILCAYTRSWAERAQLAVRYEIPVDEASLPRAGELTPIGRIASARGAVLVTEARELFDGDRRAAECLEPSFASQALASRIQALQALRP